MKVRNYCIVTGAYWSFMLTDGALRMLVLLYFHKIGYTPLELSLLFLLYEFFGIVTNVFGGWMGSRFGLKSTLLSGLFLQIISLLSLSLLDENWPNTYAISFVVLIQSLSGISKDLTKMSSKTAIKFLIPEDAPRSLFKWVAILTGSKNTIKGLGFFVGALLLQFAGFQLSLWCMASLIAVIFAISLFSLPSQMGKSKSKNRLAQLFSQGKNINLLSTSRVFLFGARDIWFVVAVPVFMHSVLGWNFSQIGGFMAAWVILYGFVQGCTPFFLKLRIGKNKPGGRVASELAILLALSIIPILLLQQTHYMTMYSLVIGLYLFGFLFALNSSVHSYLIIDYADGDKAAMNVGFYYMANALGRLTGTLLSGILFQCGGLSMCLTGSLLFLVANALISLKLKR